MENVAHTENNDTTTTDPRVLQVQPENASHDDMEATSDERSKSRNRNLDILKAYIQRQRTLLERIKQDVDRLQAARPFALTPTTDLPGALSGLLLNSDNNNSNGNSTDGIMREDGNGEGGTHVEGGIGRLSELVNEVLGGEERGIVKEIDWGLFRGHDTTPLRSLPSPMLVSALASASTALSTPHSPMPPPPPSTPTLSTSRSSPLSAFAFPTASVYSSNRKSEPSALVTRVREMRRVTVGPALERATEYMAKLGLPPEPVEDPNKGKDASKANRKPAKERERARTTSGAMGTRGANARRSSKRRKSEASAAAAMTRPRGHGGRFRKKEAPGGDGGGGDSLSVSGSVSTSVSGSVAPASVGKGKAPGRWQSSASTSTSGSPAPEGAPRGRLTIRIPVRRALKGKSVIVGSGDGGRVASPSTGVISSAGGSWGGKRSGNGVINEEFKREEGGEEDGDGGEEDGDGEDRKSVTTMRSGSASLVRFAGVKQEDEESTGAMDIDMDERNGRFRNESGREFDFSRQVKKESMFYPDRDPEAMDVDQSDPFSASDDSFVCEALPPSPGPSSSTPLPRSTGNGRGKANRKNSTIIAEAEAPRGSRRGDKDSKTFNVTWSDEEQRVLDMLLERYPDGTKNRWANISRAMGGSRTPRQVASRVQKYFAKMKQWGIDVP